MTQLAKEEPPPRFLLDGSCMFAGGHVKGVSQARWTEIGPGFTGDTVADDGSEWIWVDGDQPQRERIIAAPKAACCAVALASSSR